MPRSVHPGEILKEELEFRGLSIRRFALAVGVPPNRVAAILKGGRAVTADTALRLGRFFGNNPRFWMNLQSGYELNLAERRRGAEIRRTVRSAA